MRRFRIIGLALLALLALSALGTAVASGLEGVLGSTTFQVVGGEAKLETELANSEIKCTKVTGNGIFLAKSDEHGTATLDFTGCKTNGLGANSLGDLKEVILSKVLFLVCLVEPVKLIFGLLIEPLATEHLEVPVGGLLILVKGPVIAENTSGLTGDGGLGKVFKHELVGAKGVQTKALTCEILELKLKHNFLSALDSLKEDEKTSENAAFEVIFPAKTELMDK